MKNTITAFALITGLSLSGQTKKEGIIEYEQVIDLHASLSKDQEAYKAFIPKTSASTVQVFFKDNAYKVEYLPLETKSKDGSSKVSVQFTSGGGDRLVDKDKKIVYSYHKSGDKNYYTEEPIKKETVVIDKKTTKKILNYACYKATITASDNESYEIWFTSDPGVQANPMFDGVTEGLVLEIRNKKINLLAKKIEFKKTEGKKYTVPLSFKKISAEQAEDLDAEQVESSRQGH